MQQIGFGGGCHWCTEAVFASLRGVERVRQGWIASTLEEANTFSEAVIVTFDKKAISLETLIEIHLHTHNATSNHTLRKKYRSAIYTFDNTQQRKAQSILEQQQKSFDKPLVTRVYPFGRFRENSERYLNYYHNNPHLPFCQTRIEPKLKILFDKYAEYAIVAAKKD